MTTSPLTKLDNDILEYIPQITEWVKFAGKIALRHWQKVEPIFKVDNTVVTQADIEVEEFLVAKFRAAFPMTSLISEEGVRLNQASTWPYIWTIDPIDGTNAFSQGLSDWGIAVGMLYHHVPVFGLLYTPCSYTITLSHAGYSGISETSEQVEINQAKNLRREWKQNDFLAVSSASIHRHFSIDIANVRTIGSVCACLSYVARGVAAAGLLPKAHIWDLVAGAAILKSGSGELRYLDGTSIDYQSLLAGQLIPQPIIAGHPELLDELLESRAIKGIIRKMGE